ncbi:hypothetical protein T439DRAFT_379499 [Meredithblackwellia eburnea MCA 4105]
MTSAQSTILVHYQSPLDINNANDHINEIRTHKATSVLEQAQLNSDNTWVIKNKYYTAKVTLKPIQDSSQSSGEEPAVIVLASRSEAPSEELASMLSPYSAREPELDVALLITHPSSPSSASSTIDEDAWDDFALSYGFEWIDLAAGYGKPQIDGEEQGEETIGEESGIARVVAALHAHMWQDMELAPKEKKRQNVTDRGVDSRQEGGPVEVEEDEAAEFARMGAPPLPEPRPFVPTPLSFPDTFLPSMKRSEILSSPKYPTLATTTTTSSPQTDAPTTPFDDDFAPFVPSLPKDVKSFPPLPSSLPLDVSSANKLFKNPTTTASESSLSPLSPTSSKPRKSTDSGPLPSPLYRHPGFAFPDSVNGVVHHNGEEGGFDDPTEAELEEQDLDSLLQKLRGFKTEAQGIESLEERRAFAERVMGGLGFLDDED